MKIDSHQHFWRLANPWTDWPTPELTAIHRDYGPGDLEPWLTATQVEATLLIQAAPSFEETLDLLRIAREVSFVVGVVGWIDFGAPAVALASLDQLAAEPLLLGVRPMLQSISQPGWILDPSRTAIFDTLIDRGLVFDALVRPHHLAAIAELADRYPGLRIVIDHAAKPDIASGKLGVWEQGMRRLASAHNVSCKLSGLLTEAPLGVDPAVLRPFVDTLLGLFGSRRLLWGSDWPVIELAGGYQHWHGMAAALLSNLSEPEFAAVFGGNAARIYRPPPIDSLRGE